MLVCPVCETTANEGQEYCLNCAWEFEYFFDELDSKEKDKYLNRVKIYQSIYNKSSHMKIDEKITIKEVSEPKVDIIENSGSDDLIVINNVMYQKLSFYNYNKMDWIMAKYGSELDMYDYDYNSDYDDWRLPTVEEVIKLIHLESFKIVPFHKENSFIWTSKEFDNTHAYSVSLKDGKEYSMEKNINNYVLYVRDIKEEEKYEN